MQDQEMVIGFISNEWEFWRKKLWPPSSPGCNPLDYNVWGACEKTIDRSPHNTLDSQKTALVAGFTGIPCAAEGGFIE